ncbi:MAG TPA: O-antigen ligase family protein [Bryobacteraceae bacterium]|nr:O-antigen ligase family protein [Bryobacteraceae bacterium]
MSSRSITPFGVPVKRAGARAPVAAFQPLPTAIAPGKVKFSTRLGMGLVFLMFSMLHQIQSMLMGVNLYLLYFFAVPALAAVVFTGGIQRAFRGRPAIYWTGFAVCIFLAAPFSTWPGGSVTLLMDYFRTSLPVMFVIAGLVTTWRDCKGIMSVIAASAAINVLSARLFQGDDKFGGRVGLSLGTVANPNDYAGHLLLVLPFLVWVLLSSKSFVLRIGAGVAFSYGIYLILGTASRGAVIGLAIGGLVFFVTGTARQRFVVAIALPVGVAVLLSTVSGSALRRITSFTAADANVYAEGAEALESSASREYLLKTSLLYIVQHPVFGVGPGQFKTYEGTHNTFIGGHGEWHDTHNAYTQAASECGIPAFLFFLAGIVSTFRLMIGTRRVARLQPGCQDLVTATNCAIVGFSAFCTAIIFLNFAYFFYLPAMGGFAVALATGAKDELRSRAVLVGPQTTGRL